MCTAGAGEPLGLCLATADVFDFVRVLYLFTNRNQHRLAVCSVAIFLIQGSSSIARLFTIRRHPFGEFLLRVMIAVVELIFTVGLRARRLPTARDWFGRRLNTFGFRRGDRCRSRKCRWRWWRKHLQFRSRWWWWWVVVE